MPDSWVVLRLLEGDEPAASRVESALRIDGQQPTMSWIDVGKVFYIVIRLRGRDEAESAVRDLRARIDVELPTAERVLAAAAIKAANAMAYADAFAAATAIAHDAVLLTGDPELLIANVLAVGGSPPPVDVKPHGSRGCGRAAMWLQQIKTLPRAPDCGGA